MLKKFSGLMDSKKGNNYLSVNALESQVNENLIKNTVLNLNEPLDTSLLNQFLMRGKYYFDSSACSNTEASDTSIKTKHPNSKCMQKHCIVFSILMYLVLL